MAIAAINVSAVLFLIVWIGNYLVCALYTYSWRISPLYTETMRQSSRKVVVAYVIAPVHITLSLPCGEQKRHTRSMNHRAVALRIELVHKVDDHLYPRVILLTVFLLTAICLFPYH